MHRRRLPLFALAGVVVLAAAAIGARADVRARVLPAASSDPATLAAAAANAAVEELLGPPSALDGPGGGPSLLPRYEARFADPAILLDDGVYYAYSPRGSNVMHIPVMQSTDLVQWTAPRNALPVPPAWADGGNPRTWAPSVTQVGQDYVMWYTVRDRTTRRQCISVARASSPLGPFLDESAAPAICQLDRAGSIDPEVFTDRDGARYLLWKSEDNALGLPTYLWASRLSADATAVGEYVHLLTHAAAWQGAVVEGPAMVREGAASFLFYGANNWSPASAGIGYATGATPLGPCTDATPARPWLDSYGPALGPSGPQIFTDTSGRTRMAYHAWNQCVGPPPCGRALYIASLSFRQGRPVLGR